MSDFYLAVIPVTDDPALLSVFEALVEVSRACQIELLGHDDLVDEADVLQRGYLLQEDDRKIALVACAGSPQDGSEFTPEGLVQLTPELLQRAPVTVLGSALLWLPVNDNREITFQQGEVAPEQRGRGIGTALVQAMDDLAVREGRTIAQRWSDHRDEADPDQANALVAPTGAGALDRDDPAVRFLLSQGSVLEQTERHSQLTLPIERAVLEELQATVEEKSDGYRVISWQGLTPHEHLEGMAVLRARMSVDIPVGNMASEPEIWDPERVLRQDQNAVTVGRLPYTSVAQEIATGKLVAYTRMVSPANPEVCYQGDTLVHGDHRGHRLGLLVKLANLAALVEKEPAVRRIHTWNAGENEWMLAINVALGFRRASTEGVWQKTYA